MLLRVRYERVWERLIESLNNWTSASETGAGQIEVALPDNSVPARHVVIVMTPDEWDQMVTVMWGNFDGAFQDVKRTLLTMQPDDHFAVYADYRMESSTEPTLPEPPDITPEPGGEWVAYDREGRIESRFADWSDPNEPR